MKNLFQLKSRITWEIQALTAKAKRIDNNLALANVTAAEVDPRLVNLRRRIDNQIAKLTELGKARVAIKKLGRLLPRLDTIQRDAAKRDLRTMHRRARDLRTELAL